MTEMAVRMWYILMSLQGAIDLSGSPGYAIIGQGKVVMIW
jgi:hypothetical protein